MQFERLQVERQKYGDNKGKVTGAVKYSDPVGEMTLALSERQCDEILRIISDTMVRMTNDLANNMTSSIITQKSLGVD